MLASDSSGDPATRLEALLREKLWLAIVRKDGEEPVADLIEDADIDAQWLAARLESLPEETRLELRTWSGRAWREDAVPPRD